MTQSRMDRDSLVAQVAQRTGNSTKTVEKIVDSALEEIYASIKRGESVSLRNFGTFYQAQPTAPTTTSDGAAHRGMCAAPSLVTNY